MGIIYIVATPIGNLKDITLRSIEILKECDLVLSEDTRVTKKLLSHFNIKKPVWRCDEYASNKTYEEIISLLKRNSDVCFLTDAGTPVIADPGWRFIKYIKEKERSVKIIPLPGPSSVTAILSVSPFNANNFTFVGYPPHKKGREKFFENLKNVNFYPIVIFESPHRIKKTLENIIKAFGEEVFVVIGREITKIHEDIFYGNAKEAFFYFGSEKQRGEFVILINK